MSCNSDGWSCNGGWFVHDYHQWKYVDGETAAGAVWEDDFPYKASDVSCNPPHPHHEKIDSWAYVDPNVVGVPAVNAIKQAIFDHGPVGAAVCVNLAFQLYHGGVFNPRIGCNSINHAIVLVGWNDADGAWILRNSWGPSWGEGGYMRIAYGKSQVGYAANYVVYTGCTSNSDCVTTDEICCNGQCITTPACGDNIPCESKTCHTVSCYSPNACDAVCTYTPISPCCGNGMCEGNENSSTCPADCCAGFKEPCGTDADCCDGLRCNPVKKYCR